MARPGSVGGLNQPCRDNCRPQNDLRCMIDKAIFVLRLSFLIYRNKIYPVRQSNKQRIITTQENLFNCFYLKIRQFFQFCIFRQKLQRNTNLTIIASQAHPVSNILKKFTKTRNNITYYP